MISPRKPIPLLLRPLIALSEKIAGKRLDPARILSRTPRIALVSGLVETGIERAARRLDKRTAALVRIQASLSVNCPFCIDMNLADPAAAGVSRTEVEALRLSQPETQESFGEQELLLLRYVAALSETPLDIAPELVIDMEKTWGADGIVRIAALAAKVNYWARLIQGLGIPPGGYLTSWELPGDPE